MSEAQTLLEEFDQQIKDLKTRAQTSTGRIRLQVDREIEELKRKASSARDQLRKFESASGEAWKEMEMGLDYAIDELRGSCRRARRHFK